MIIALLKRRLWLWKNRFLSGFFLVLIMPVIIFMMVSLPMENILVRSLLGVSYDIWVLPGLIFIISSLVLFPLLHRDFFDLRIHNKVLGNIALAPYSKNMMIMSYLFVAGMEALVAALISMVIYSGFISFTFSFAQFGFMVLCLLLYILILGNLFITVSLLTESITSHLFITFMIFIIILFGSGLIIEFSFFPRVVETVLIFQPLSIPFRTLQIFLSNGTVQWALIGLSLFLALAWILANSFLLKYKLRQ